MKVCVFCGSFSGKHPVYAQGAIELGNALAGRGHSLIYGGGKVGLMGIIADTMLKQGAPVIGVIPDFLVKREVGHNGLTEQIIVKSMHERKQKMAALADAFIAMPGGWGTMDELAEILTWKQLGLIQQPVGLLNINHFYNSLARQMQQMVDEGFLRIENFQTLNIDSEATLLLNKLGL